MNFIQETESGRSQVVESRRRDAPECSRTREVAKLQQLGLSPKHIHPALEATDGDLNKAADWAFSLCELERNGFSLDSSLMALKETNGILPRAQEWCLDQFVKAPIEQPSSSEMEVDEEQKDEDWEEEEEEEQEDDEKEEEEKEEEEEEEEEEHVTRITKKTKASASRRLPSLNYNPTFYFYYENVGTCSWGECSQFLWGADVEFVDAQDFSACRRLRGYLHNLPREGRVKPRNSPKTIQEALPITKKYWPSWDSRTKLNCINTKRGPAADVNRIRELLKEEEGRPSESTQEKIMKLCKKWNFVWTGVNQVTNLEPPEIEKLLGFPEGHTRPIAGISERLKALGNSFHVPTVESHLSVLKREFPNGINVLSLFDGIGGAAVALFQSGIKINVYISVEIKESSQEVVKRFFQERMPNGGRLILEKCVEGLNTTKLQNYVLKYGKFDLLIGGSPCDNFTGNNRVPKDKVTGRCGILGRTGRLFFHFYRIAERLENVQIRLRQLG